MRAFEGARKKTGNLFTTKIWQLAAQIGEEEEKLFKQAKAIATAIEFEFLKPFLYSEEIPAIKSLIDEELQKYDTNNVYANKKLIGIFERINRARLTERWEHYETTFLPDLETHMYQTGIFAWLMAIELGKFEEEGVILREICDALEIKGFSKYFYPNISKKAGEYYSKYVDLNGVTEEYHKLIKKADYLSADFEIFLQFQTGSRDADLAKILFRDADETPRTPESHKLLVHFAEQVKKIVVLEI